MKAKKKAIAEKGEGLIAPENMETPAKKKAERKMGFPDFTPSPKKKK